MKTADNTKNIKGKEKLRLNIFSGKKISVIFAFTVLIFSCGCIGAGNEGDIASPDSGLTDSSLTSTEPSWEKDDPSHGNKADPDYSVVFPDDEVQVINITISPENWQEMLDNMTEIYGEFGNSDSKSMPGGNNGDGNFGAGNIPEDFSAKNHGSEMVNPGDPADRQNGGMPEGGPDGMIDEATPVYVRSDVTFEGLEWEDVGIRFKGQMTLRSSWSEGNNKISFKLNFDKFEDENPAIKNQRFYGFDELNLQSGYGDDSLMRDMIVPSIFRDSGVPAPYTAFYRVYVDYGEGPVYFGLYTMVESIEDTVTETQFEDDSGNVYKPQGDGATFAEGTFDTEAFEKKTNEDEADWTDVESLYEILNSDLRTKDPQQWREDLESVLNVDEFLRWLATNTVIQNWDTYGGNCRNFYLYTDPSDGRITWVPWDNNFALRDGMAGNEGELPAENPVLMENMAGFQADSVAENPRQGGFFPGNEGGNGQAAGDGRGGTGKSLSLSLDDAGDNWPLIRYIADDPVYYGKYLDYLEMVANDSFEPEKMEELYTRYHSMIEPYVTGENGETEGYTHLESPEDFAESLNELIEHTYSRYNAVMEFISGQ
ncbi:CotH kinase family protein [Methanoplanus limicola]|uniref:CotH kinase family protein n=1 Tax=Methanoplanus limicola TaxID=2315 RepID=UPI00069413BD|nr:CotH kinase family protein [Methanoplanus limicola]